MGEKRCKFEYLYCGQYGMRLADDTYNNRTLLHSFLCILDLEYSALG